jgi:hypothetical protein
MPSGRMLGAQLGTTRPFARSKSKQNLRAKSLRPGTFYVSLAQPLAPLIMAALEPDSQNSFVANRLLDLSTAELRRVMAKPPSAAIAGLANGGQD